MRKVSSPAPSQPAPACFHCGLPVPAGQRWLASVLGEIRDFCCGGCRAVAEAISRGGLDDYYRLRTGKAPKLVSTSASDASARMRFPGTIWDCSGPPETGASWLPRN
jgi:hypothetical protein